MDMPPASPGPDSGAPRIGTLIGGQAAAEAGPSVAELFRDHHLELVRLALVMTGDLATAEDVVQDCFERLHRRWPAIREPSRALAYARSSVLNGCRSVHRRAAVGRKYEPRLAQRADATVPDPTTAMADRGELAGALRGLQRRQREVLVLRYYADLTVAEIAETLRITPSSVRASMSRGLTALAAAIGEEQQ